MTVVVRFEVFRGRGNKLKMMVIIVEDFWLGGIKGEIKVVHVKVKAVWLKSGRKQKCGFRRS